MVVKSGRQNSITFELDGMNYVHSLTICQNSDEKLYRAFIGRKNINVDFSKVKKKEDAQKLKSRLLAKYPSPTEAEYRKAAKDYDHAAMREHQATVMHEFAKQIVYDLADASAAGVSDQRYANIVCYAKNLVAAVAEGKSIEDVKEPGRSVLEKIKDKVTGADSLKSAKNFVGVYAGDQSFTGNEPDKAIFIDMARDIPTKPIKSRAMGKDGDRVVNAFMDVCTKRMLLTKSAQNKAFASFAPIFVRREIARDVSVAFDEELRAYFAKRLKEKKVAKIQAEKRRYEETKAAGRKQTKARVAAKSKSVSYS
ncbi:MAG: hypothetical protein J6T72_02495 [Alphaproteobacteria bacterium]|nr:hypothetical protein [Alphaproteobacteria bacterium]